MSVSFAELKKSRNANLARVQEEIEKQNKPTFTSDEDKFWQPKLDKAGNGYAVIRFLPAPPGEDLPYTRLFRHWFDGPGGKYSENCLTTIGQKDPVTELNNKLWNAGKEDQARAQKRNLVYHMNILVLKHPSNPDDEGKVFQFRCGVQIFKKLEALMVPPEDEAEAADFKPIDVFDFWGGCNFKFRQRQKGGYKNYEESAFDAPSALYDGDEKKLENVWKQCQSLAQHIAPEKFKSYAELKARLDKVLGEDAGDESGEIPFEEPKTTAKAPAKKAAKAPTKKAAAEDDDIDALLNSLDE